MVKKSINALIFLFIFSLYFVSFLMIYDTFRERKIADLEGSAKKKKKKEVKIKEVTKEEIEDDNTYNGNFNYEGYTILGLIDIPSIGFNSVIIREYSYDAMNVGVIKTYGSELNEPGGFIISGHNFRGRSLFMYNVHRLTSGDKIYITDGSGNKLEYTVYEVQRYVDPNDTSVYTSYDGYNVTLITCEDGGKTRIIVKARA